MFAVRHVDALRIQTLLAASLYCISTTASQAAGPPITDLAFAPEGQTIVATSQRGISVFAWPSLQLQRTLKCSAANLHCVSFSPKGKLLAAGGGDPSETGILEVFDWPSGTSQHMSSAHDDSVTSVAWRGESALYTSGLDRRILLHDISVQAGETIVQTPQELLGHSRGVMSLSLLDLDRTQQNAGSEVTLVSVGFDQSLRVWNGQSGVPLRNLNQHTQPIHKVVAKPTREGLPIVATASQDRTIRIWQPTIGRMVRYIRLPSVPLDLAWTEDGNRLLAACQDGQLRIIDPVNVAVTETLQAIEQGWAYSLAIDPSGQHVVIGGAGGELQTIRLTR
ncbi:MAG: WD40 repeat domain-containing protein [Pirellulaceae bacterium]